MKKMFAPIISAAELRHVKKACDAGKSSIELSLDLGLTKTRITLEKEGMIVNNTLVPLPKIRDDDKTCYLLENNKWQKLQIFSPVTKLMYKLIPTKGRPLLQVSGTSMHKQSFIERIEKEQLQGTILDAGTGLGYTAITAAQTAKQVITIEHDPTILELQNINPWSQELFTRKNITQVEGDLPQYIKKLPQASFDNIIYDAGAPRSSGMFFSLENYAETFRILKRKGKLLHYLPRPQIQAGRDFAAEVIKRLQEIGFTLIERNREDCYVILQKP